jgi:DNA-binding MarR family transcriptional regulator
VQATVASKQALARDLAAFLIHIHKTSSSQWFQTIEELGLTLTQIKVLHALSDRELPVKAIADEIGLSLPAISRAVEGLVGRGLVERRESAEDRRQRLVTRTPAADAVVERLMQARIAGLEAFVDELDGAQRTALSNALKEVSP